MTLSLVPAPKAGDPTGIAGPLAELLLSGDAKDGDTIALSAGAEGLIIGDRIGATNRERPGDAVVH